MIRILIILLLVSPGIAAANTALFSWTLVTDDPVIAVDWSPDGERIAVSDLVENTVGIFNLSTGAYDWRFSLPDDSDSWFLRWSPDGAYIAVLVESSIYLLNAGNNQDYRILSANPKYHIVAARWSADSQRLAALSNGYIEIWDIVTGEITQTVDLGSHVEVSYPSFDWSPDGQIFAAPYNTPLAYGAGASLIGFWDAKGNLIDAYMPQNQTEFRSGAFCYNYGEDSGELLDIEWASDGKTIAVSGYDGYGTCTLSTNLAFERREISGDFTTVVRWSPDQRWLASADAEGTYAWSCLVRITDVTQSYITTVEPISSHDCSVSSLAWSPDSGQLAVGASSGLWIGTLAN